MPWYEVYVEARITVCIEADDSEQARMDAYDECFTGIDKDVSEPKLLETEEDIDRSKRHADEIMPMPNATSAIETKRTKEKQMTQLVSIGNQTIEEVLGEKLESDFPGWSIELGENWEMIATIFFNAGRYGEREPEYSAE